MRFELTTSASLSSACTAYKYGALTDCATGAHDSSLLEESASIPTSRTRSSSIFLGLTKSSTYWIVIPIMMNGIHERKFAAIVIRIISFFDTFDNSACYYVFRLFLCSNEKQHWWDNLLKFYAVDGMVYDGMSLDLNANADRHPWNMTVTHLISSPMDDRVF